MVIVELDWSISEGELRGLMRELWSVQVGPVLSTLPLCDTDPSAVRELSEAQELCQRLINNGFLSLLTLSTPRAESRTRRLYTACDLYGIAKRRWIETEHGWRVNVQPAEFRPVWESLKGIAVKHLHVGD